MRVDKLYYSPKNGFVSYGPEPVNPVFKELVITVTLKFDEVIKTHINPDGGIESAEITDFHPETDELLITYSWRYYGLSRREREKADQIFSDKMQKMNIRCDEINFAMV